MSGPETHNLEGPRLKVCKRHLIGPGPMACPKRHYTPETHYGEQGPIACLPDVCRLPVVELHTSTKPFFHPMSEEVVSSRWLQPTLMLLVAVWEYYNSSLCLNSSSLSLTQTHFMSRGGMLVDRSVLPYTPIPEYFLCHL